RATTRSTAAGRANDRARAARGGCAPAPSAGHLELPGFRRPGCSTGVAKDLTCGGGFGIRRRAGAGWRFSASRRRFLPLSPSGGRNSPLVPDIAGEIVGKIGHADLGAGAGDTDRAHEQAHAGFLLREDVFDEGPDL